MYYLYMHTSEGWVEVARTNVYWVCQAWVERSGWGACLVGDLL